MAEKGLVFRNPLVPDRGNPAAVLGGPAPRLSAADMQRLLAGARSPMGLTHSVYKREQTASHRGCRKVRVRACLCMCLGGFVCVWACLCVGGGGGSQIPAQTQPNYTEPKCNRSRGGGGGARRHEDLLTRCVSPSTL